MRVFSLLVLLLAVLSPLRAQDGRSLPVPLLLGAPGPVPGDRELTKIAAQLAQERGLPSQAIRLYRQLIATAVLPAERLQLTLALTTALLDDGDVAGAEAALLTLSPPYNSAWNLRAGLVQAQQKHWDLARGHLNALKPEELSAADRGWGFFLQGMLAEQSGDGRADAFYTQAEGAAVSSVQRSRFLLAREQVLLRLGSVTSEMIASTKLNMDSSQSGPLGHEFAIDYAIELDATGKKQEAIGVLQQRLRMLAPGERVALDRTWLHLGLIAGTGSEVGREALGRLLADGSDPNFQRIALLLLANAKATPAQSADFRRRLDTLIALAPPHRIREDLLLKRAELSLAEKTLKGYQQAEDDAKELQQKFPGSTLTAPALAILTSAAWERRQYLQAADYADKARKAVSDPPARARFGLLMAEAYYRSGDYRSAANAYQAVLGVADRPDDVPVGNLMFQRVLAEIEATRFEVEAEAGRPGEVLDQLASDPAFDVENRWQAEFNLSRKLLAVDRKETAYNRVNKLLAAPPAAGAALSPALRARMAWLQVRLALNTGKPGEALTLIKTLPTQLNGVDAALAGEIRSTALLMQAEAERDLGQEETALTTLGQLRRDFKTSAAAAQSYLIEAAYLSSKDQITNAQQLLVKLADDFPTSPYAPQALYQAALLDEQKGDRSGATTRLQKLITAYPDSDMVFIARFRQGELQQLMAQFPLAQQAFELIIKQYPTHPGIHSAEISLADSISAQATTDPTARDRAELMYDRLRDLPDARVDLRVEAGHKYGLILVARGKIDLALDAWWKGVVTPFLLDKTEAAELGGPGKIWMSRTLLLYGKNAQDQGKRDEARNAWNLLVTSDLPGKEQAAAQLAPPAPAPGQ